MHPQLELFLKGCHLLCRSRTPLQLPSVPAFGLYRLDYDGEHELVLEAGVTHGKKHRELVPTAPLTGMFAKD